MNDLERIKYLDNWTKISPEWSNDYRFVVSPKACYEIYTLNWDVKTKPNKASAMLCFVDKGVDIDKITIFREIININDSIDNLLENAYNDFKQFYK